MGKMHKAAASDHFTKVSNKLIRDKKVTDGAFRLICWIFSHDDGFSVSFAGITKALGYGKDKIKSIVKNAEQNDYLVRIKTNDSKTGLIDWDYYVFPTQEETISFRLQNNIHKPGGVNPSMAKGIDQGGVNQGMVEPCDGLAPPHKKNNSSKKTSFKEERERGGGGGGGGGG
ncbi:MAG: helix-turn-helix domain-containing protein, partial [Brasilonema sp.]